MAGSESFLPRTFCNRLPGEGGRNQRKSSHTRPHAYHNEQKQVNFWRHAICFLFTNYFFTTCPPFWRIYREPGQQPTSGHRGCNYHFCAECILSLSLLMAFCYSFHPASIQPLYPFICFVILCILFLSTSKHPPITFPFLFRPNHPPNPSSLESASIPNLIRLFDPIASLPCIQSDRLQRCEVLLNAACAVALPIT